MLLIDNAEVPVLVRITVCDALIEPTVVAANVRVLAERVTLGANPVPLNAIL